MSIMHLSIIQPRNFAEKIQFAENVWEIIQ